MDVVLGHLALLALFMTIIAAVVETIKEILKMMPDKVLGIKIRWFCRGLNKKEVRALSFIMAWITARYAKIQIITILFKSFTVDNGRDIVMGEELEYFILACICFVGAKFFYKAYKNAIGHLEDGKNDETR